MSKEGMTLEPNSELWERLTHLKDEQEPLRPGMPRHPSKKDAYFRALAVAFEAGMLLPVRDAQEISTIGEWTSVEERMPKIGEVVDVWVQAVDCAYRGSDFSWSGSEWNSDGHALVDVFGNVAMTITHWRGRPEAPRGFEKGHGDINRGVGRSRFVVAEN